MRKKLLFIFLLVFGVFLIGIKEVGAEDSCCGSSSLENCCNSYDFKCEWCTSASDCSLYRKVKGCKVEVQQREDEEGQLKPWCHYFSSPSDCPSCPPNGCCDQGQPSAECCSLCNTSTEATTQCPPVPGCIAEKLFDPSAGPYCRYSPNPSGCAEEEPLEKVNWCPEARFSGLASILDTPKLLQCAIRNFFSFVLKLPAMLFAFIGAVLSYIASIIFRLAVAMLMNFMTINFKMSVYDARSIMIVQAVMQKVALYLILLFIAFVGLATILEWQAYEFRRRLFPLFFAAVLIFFSSTIVNLIVQIGNITTNFFISLAAGLTSTQGRVTGPDLPSKIGGVLGSIADQILSLGGHFNVVRDIALLDGYFQSCLLKVCKIGEEYRGPFIIPLFISVFSAYAYLLVYLIGTLAVGIFFVIFLLRIVWIWLLKAVAPIAFFAWAMRGTEIDRILPGPLTWNGWWTNLLTWSFIGIPLILWLTIAIAILQSTTTLQYSSQPLSQKTLATFQTVEPENLFVDPSSKTFFATSVQTQIVKQTGGYITPEITESSQIIQNFSDIYFSNFLTPFIAFLALFMGATTSVGIMGQVATQAFEKGKQWVTRISTYPGRRLRQEVLLSRVFSPERLDRWSTYRGIGRVAQGLYKARQGVLEELARRELEKPPSAQLMGALAALRGRRTEVADRILERMRERGTLGQALRTLPEAERRGVIGELWGRSQFQGFLFQSYPDLTFPLIPENQRVRFFAQLRPQDLFNITTTPSPEFINSLARYGSPGTLASFLRLFGTQTITVEGQQQRVLDYLLQQREGIGRINPQNAQYLLRLARNLPGQQEITPEEQQQIGERLRRYVGGEEGEEQTSEG